LTFRPLLDIRAGSEAPLPKGAALLLYPPRAFVASPQSVRYPTMQVVEKSNEGLSRVIAVTIPAAELNEKLEARIKEMAPQMKLKGFRPGKVPASHVKKTFGRDFMGEIINASLNETSQGALEELKIRPAAPAEMKLTSDMDKVIAGQEDLAYEMSLEVMPEFTPVDPKTLKLTRPTYEASDEDLDEALKELASQAKSYEDKKGKTVKAADGDQLTIDFLGKIDGEAFDGGAATDADLVIGSGRFIPGFEEQLVGVKAGDEKVLNVSFPDDYPSANLAGKAATFETKVHEVRAPQTPALDDEFAKGLGLESLEQLTGLVRDQLTAEHANASRSKAKRDLLDKLDAAHSFDLPQGMVGQEFDQIWQQLQREMDAGRVTDEEKKKPEDELKAEYRRIAERRVRLGLVLAEIGRVADVRITEQEVNQALIREARQYPGQEREVVQFFQKNPNAMAQLRAPIYEDKVVDHILTVATVDETMVSREDLFKEDEV